MVAFRRAASCGGFPLGFCLAGNSTNLCKTGGLDKSLWRVRAVVLWGGKKFYVLRDLTAQANLLSMVPAVYAPRHSRVPAYAMMKSFPVKLSWTSAISGGHLALMWAITQRDPRPTANQIGDDENAVRGFFFV